MKIKKAGAVLFLLMMLILSSCGFDTDEPKEERIRKEKRKYTVTVSNKAGPVGLKAVEKFCLKANELSDGDLTLVYKVSEDALNDFYNGSDFIFATNAEISRANGDFASYTSPFYFNDRDSALLTLNSSEFLNQTSDITQSLLNAKQLGCFYNGAYMFVSNKIEDLLMFEPDGEPLNTFDGLRLYGEFEYIDDYLLSKLGIDIVNSNLSEMIEKFNEAQCHTIMIKKHNMGELKLSPKRDSVFYYSQPYKYDFNWLFISDEVTEDMSRRYSDILREAVAYALGYNDDEIIKLENEAENHIYELPYIEVGYSQYGAEAFCEEAYKSVRFKRTWDINNHQFVKSIME